MKDFDEGLLTGIVAAMVVMLIIMFSATTPNMLWRAKAIEHGAARYHPQTGAFEWIEKSVTP